MCYTSIWILLLMRDASDYSHLREMSHYCVRVGIRGNYLNAFTRMFLRTNTILVATGTQYPMVHLNQSFWMSVAPPIVLANNNWAHLAKPQEPSINPVIFLFWLHTIWRRMMTHHLLLSDFCVFEDAAVLNPCFWRTHRRSSTRDT